MTTRATATLTVGSDITGNVAIYGTSRPQTAIALHAGPADQWDPAIATIHADNPDALVALANIVLEAAEQLRAAQAATPAADAA